MIPIFLCFLLQVPQVPDTLSLHLTGLKRPGTPARPFSGEIDSWKLFDVATGGTAMNQGTFSSKPKAKKGVVDVDLASAIPSSGIPAASELWLELHATLDGGTVLPRIALHAVPFAWTAAFAPGAVFNGGAVTGPTTFSGGVNINPQAATTTIVTGSPSSPFAPGDIAATNDLIADGNVVATGGAIRAGSPSSGFGPGDVAATQNVLADGNVVATSGSVLAGSPAAAFGPGDVAATDDLLADDDVLAGDSIGAGGSITAGGALSAGGNITTPADVVADDMVAGGAILAGSIRTGSPSPFPGAGDIAAGDDLIASNNVTAGGSITAGSLLTVGPSNGFVVVNGGAPTIFAGGAQLTNLDIQANYDMNFVRDADNNDSGHMFRWWEDGLTGGSEIMRLDADVQAELLVDGPVTANGLDLAEYYPTTEAALEPGDVVAVDPARAEHVVKARPGLVPLGVVPTAPGLKLGGEMEGGFPELLGASDAAVAAGRREEGYALRQQWREMVKARNDRVLVSLAGRVPVKVDAGSSPIRRGDALGLSARAGYAALATEGGAVIGIALDEQKDGLGVIPCFVVRGGWIAARAGANSAETGQRGTGAATAPAGERIVTVRDSRMRATSSLFLTFLGDPGSRWWIQRKDEGSFTLAFGEPSVDATRFEYLIESGSP